MFINKFPITIPVLVGFVLAILILVYFGKSLTMPLYSDDYVAFQLHHHLKRFFVNWYTRSVSILFVYFTNLLFGTNFFYYHTLLLLIHWINAYLLYVIITKIEYHLTDALQHWQAFIAAALFAIYPFHQESVVWFVGNGSSIALMCCLISLTFYLNIDSRRSYFISIFFYILSGLVYESVLFFPVSLFIISHFVLRIHYKRIIPYVIIMITMLACQSFYNYFIHPNNYLNIQLQPAQLINNFIKFSFRLLLPPNQAIYYWHILIGSLVYFMLLLHSIWFANKKHLLLISLALAFSFVPVLFLGIYIDSNESQRMLYYPSFWLVILLYFLLRTQSIFTNLIYILLFCYFTICCLNINTNWWQSGKIIRQLSYKAAALEQCDTIYFYNLPDNIQGAFCFRNGVNDLLHLSNCNAICKIKSHSKKDNYGNYTFTPLSTYQGIDTMITRVITAGDTMMFNKNSTVRAVNFNGVSFELY